MMLVSLVACNTRPIPGDLLLTTYNSDMEATKKFAPMDTLYIKVSGVEPNKFYQVSALDADGRLIAKIEARTDGNGVLGATPLWYDIGLKSNGVGYPPYIDSYGDLTPVGFKVNVKSVYDDGDSTDFTQDMFIIYGKVDTDTNPKPVVYSCFSPDYNEGSGTYSYLYPENAFKEPGTLDVNGDKDLKTFVFVKAERIPTKTIQGADVTSVDFYVLPFTGETFKEGDSLSGSVVGPITVNVTGETAQTLLWNLNNSPDLANPTEDNMAYSIVMDVDQDGVYDMGLDSDNDGEINKYCDGVDGNGVPGFIVQNTPANDIFVTIRNGEGTTADIVNSIPEGPFTDYKLYINIDNLPVGVGESIAIYLIDSTEDGNATFTVAPADDKRSANAAAMTYTAKKPLNIMGELRYLPYIDNVELVNTNTASSDDLTVDDDVAAEDGLHLDLIIDMNMNGDFDYGTDYFMKDAVTILMVPDNPEYTTCKDSEGLLEAYFFDETNTEDGDTIIYLNAITGDNDYDVYVLNQAAYATLVTGDNLSDAAMFTVEGLSGDGVTQIWDLNGPHQVINPDINHNTYYLIVDNGAGGTLDAGDDILPVVILNTNANSYPRVTYVNIASGGKFLNTYAEHWTLYSEYCDYKDVFAANGLDTNPNGGGYGVKAVFNPYFSWFYNPDPQTPVAGLYYGLYVDVYIIKATQDDTVYFDLADYGHAGELNDGIDVTGHHSTLVVQPSCYNGAGLMTIWPAQMTPGKYYVIVDVNRNGRIDEGTDIIDAVNQAGETIIDDATVVGFTVE